MSPIPIGPVSERVTESHESLASVVCGPSAPGRKVYSPNVTVASPPSSVHASRTTATPPTAVVET